MSDVRLEDAVAAVRGRLGEEALEHCMRVSEAAGELADVYGVDANAARLAGMLHDWDREQDATTLLAEAREAGIELTEAEEAKPYLLHARTGALGVQRAFPGLDREVVQAISRHTLGASTMTPLDMVAYLADMIERNRDYDGVEELRRAVGTVSLEELFALGYRQSMTHLLEGRKIIHPVALEVWNTHVAVRRP